MEFKFKATDLQGNEVNGSDVIIEYDEETYNVTKHFLDSIEVVKESIVLLNPPKIN